MTEEIGTAICRLCGNDNIEGHTADCSSHTDPYITEPVWFSLAEA